MMTAGLYTFLVDVALALITLVGTAALLWGWFVWIAGRAMQAGTEHVPGVPPLPSISSDGRGEPDLPPPSTSPTARAEIAELETLWELPPGVRDDLP